MARPPASGLLRLIGRFALVLVALIVIAALVVYAQSERRLSSRSLAFARPPRADVLGDTARGRHLLTTVSACAYCHGPDLGGAVVADDPVFRAAAPNLTRGQGGRAATLSDADFELAIRHGVRPNGRALLLMPSEAYIHLSDADVAAIVAYLRVAPPVDRDVGLSKLGPLGRVLFVTHKFNEVAADRIELAKMTPRTEPTPAADDTLGTGRYIADIAGCTGCHTPSLRGRSDQIGPPGTPLPTNITPSGIGHWTEADFVAALRMGKRPDGRPINTFMPWEKYAGMTDFELHALWRYLRTVPGGAAT